ncbi:hypothetical protein OF83DRAFT_477898 [Amylostereum chailletii]|nr:hypothetical protein OF83DRAFT_477898 [Amylostereum chailletii]
MCAPHFQSVTDYGTSKTIDMSAHRSLLIDGYIAYMLSPKGAEILLTCLLKTDLHKIQPTFEGNKVLCRSSALSHLSPLSAGQSSSVWLLDYLADVSVGTVVPQPPPAPTNRGDFQRHVANAPLQMPIYFVHSDGRPGVPLVHAAAGSFPVVTGLDQEAPMGGRTTTHFCMNWPGYGEFKKQVEIQDSHHNPITIGRLIHRVANFIDAFIQDRSTSPSAQTLWRLGGPGGVTREEILIVGVLQVSAGTWMPILQLTRHVGF